MRQIPAFIRSTVSLPLIFVLTFLNSWSTRSRVTIVTIAASGPPGSQITFGGVDRKSGPFATVRMVADQYVTLAFLHPSVKPTATSASAASTGSCSQTGLDYRHSRADGSTCCPFEGDIGTKSNRYPHPPGEPTHTSTHVPTSTPTLPSTDSLVPASTPTPTPLRVVGGDVAFTSTRNGN